jgi:trigger factor
LSQWRIQARRQAELSAREDLLLEAVAEAEDLEVDEDEIMAEIRAIAAENATDPFEQIEPLEVLGQIGRGPIVEKLLRDKARRLIIKSAVGLNEPGSAESGAEGPSAPAAAIASNDLSGQAPAAQPTKVRP